MNEENVLLENELQHNEDPQDEDTQEVQTQQDEPCTAEVPESDLSPDASETEQLNEEDVPEEDTSEEVAPEDDVPPPTEDTKSAANASEKAPYHERYYLRYRDGKRTTALDLDNTKEFLKGIGFDGGELRQARDGKDRAADFQNPEKGKSNQMYCSYCGTEIAGVEFYRLPDGRLRCTSCSSTLVKTKTEAEELCSRVIANMDNFFGATIDVPVSIRVLDERKLKKKIGVPLGTKDSQSMLILGVAINKKKKYSILLENGAPRISLIATFAHELTHIWQYTHWDNRKDFKKCPKSKRLLIYEGMAKWAEIQYLYLVGETNVAKREEYITRNREDEYGIGFCLYEDYYPLSREAMTCEDTPFTPNSYPFED